jgi:hypothetical protein
VINYVLSYSQDGVASTSEGEITVTTSIQRPTIAWSSPTYPRTFFTSSPPQSSPGTPPWARATCP